MKHWRVYMKTESSLNWLFVDYCRAKTCINAIALVARKHKHLTKTQFMFAKEMKS